MAGTQIFVRNREGKVFGPMEPSTLELLIEGGVLQGLLQVSTDGEKYALPFRFPHLRDYFPRHLWGDDARPGVTLDSDAAPGACPAERQGTGGQPPGGPGLVTAPLPPTLTPAAPPGAGVRSAAAGTRPAAGAAAAATRSPASGSPPSAAAGAAATRAPTGSSPAASPQPPATSAPSRPPSGFFPTVPPDASAPGAAASRPPTGSFPAVPSQRAPAAGPSRPPSGFFPTVAPEAPAAEPGVPTPTAPGTGGSPRAAGQVAPPVLTSAPPEPAVPPPLASTDAEGWAAAVPFELAPPGAPRPPSQTTAPLTSTFDLLRADLAETNALKIYIQGARAGATGLFFFDLPDRTATIYMRRGNPESAESTHASDAIGPFLVAQRLATAEQVARAEREALKFGNDVLAALFTLGAVNPGLVFPALAQRAADILLHAYLSPRGHFRFEAVELPPSKVVPLGNRWGLLGEVIRRVPLPELKSRLIDVRERPVVRRSAGDAPPDLRLTAQETRAMGYFDGTRSLAHLAQSNAGEMDTILRVALLLRELEAVSFPDVQLRGPPPPPPATPTPAPRAAPPPAASSRPAAAEPAPAAAPPRAAPARPAARSTAPGTPEAGGGHSEAPRIPPLQTPPRTAAPAVAVELRDLQLRLERMRKENHFQILGLPEHVDSAVVKATYIKLAKQYHPDTVAPDAPPELARIKAEIFGMVGEASRVLADDASRARYRESLADGGAEVDVQAVLQAEDTFNKGTALVRARRFVEAVKLFDDAIAANPREGEFYAWRGYARFFTLQDKKVATVEALRDLNQALKLNERCAPAHYFIGQLHKLTGDPATALKHFKRCVAIDPQHVDAQREIRLATQK